MARYNWPTFVQQGEGDNATRRRPHGFSDLREPTVTIVCEPCNRRGSYNVARLMAQYGDAKLPDLLQTIANWPKARSVSIYDRCKVVYEGLATR